MTVSFLMSCVADSTKKDEAPVSRPEVVNRLIAHNITPSDFPARTQSIITLSYTSIDNHLASSCTISNASNVSVTQACSCDGLGVCMVGVTGASAYSGAGAFSYNVVAAGKTSTTGKASFNISAPPAGSNIPPTISAIAAKTTTEGIAVSASFTVADIDSTVTCGNVTSSSSNTTVLPTANVVITGSAGNCTVTVTPAANQVGSSNVTLTLTDAGTPLPAKIAVATFTLTVNTFNDAPTISAIAAQGTLEDTPKTGIAFTIGDVDSVVTCSDVKATSSNTGLIAVSNITISGTAPNCLVGFTPSLNQSGSANITLTITDHGNPMPAKTASTTFTTIVAAVNDAPIIAPITTQNTTENIAKAVSFTVTDVDSVLSCSTSVAVTSSNTTLVPNTNVALSGIAPNCVATITPVTGQYGATTITVSVSDNGFPMPIQTSNATFVLNVAKVNRAPTISAITNKTTNEDTVTSAIPFTIADTDSIIYCSNVTGTSDNTTLVPNANIVITGTVPNCIATITPSANGYGSASITLTVTDNGTPLPALTATSIFTLTIAAVNDAPTLSTITGKTTDAGVASAPIIYTVNDIDSSLSCGSSVTATSSNTALIPNANISFAGTAPNCTIIVTPVGIVYGTSTITLTLTDNGTPMPALTATTSFVMTVTQVNQTPTISAISTQTTNEDTVINGIAFTIADSDSTVYCNNVTATSNNTTLVPNANIIVTGTAPNCIAGVTPAANGYGSASITLTLTDNGVPLPAKTATSTFSLTVNAVNDAPTISAITNKTTNQGSASAPIAFTVNDIDSTLSCASSVAMASSNTALIPNANVVFAGTLPNCTAVVTPAAGNGTSVLTFTLTDSGTPLPALTATSAFTMTVAQVNQAPIISAITNKATDEDTAISGITFSISDSDSTVYCNDVTGVSSNTAVVPSANIVITGTAPSCSATITPTANANGSSTITLTLTDNGSPSPSMTANSVFGLTVNAVNDAPTISAITSKTTDEDTPTSAIAFTVADIDSTLNCGASVTGTSSNTTLVPNANIVITGTVPNCSAVVTPAANQFGNATITLTLSDNGTPMPAMTATSAFGLTVASVPDLAGTLTLAANLSGVASAYSGNSYGRVLKFAGLSADEDVASVEVCLGTASGSCDVSSWVEGTGYTKPNGSSAPYILDGSFRMKSNVGGAQVFNLNASCGSTNNYYYSIRATNATSKLTNVISTPAWSFWEPSCLGATQLQLWLDAQEGSTFTYSTATAISDWRDKSGKGRNFLQSTANKRPTVLANGIGTNYPGVKFDGVQSTTTGDSMNLTTGSFVHALGASSIFSVVNGATLNAVKYLFGEDGANANVMYSPYGTTNTNKFGGNIVNNVNATDLAMANTDLVPFNGTPNIMIVDDAGNSHAGHMNGTTQAGGPVAYARTTSTLTRFRLGARIKNNVESGWINTSLGEFIVTNGVLSTLNRNKLEGYSAHKWGINSKLPVVHPYYISPP